MNDLIRPSLYGAWQAVVSVQEHPDGTEGVYDLVGPICETGDFLARQRALARAGRCTAGDPLVRRLRLFDGIELQHRPRPAEVMVDGGEIHLVRRRETLAGTVRQRITAAG